MGNRKSRRRLHVETSQQLEFLATAGIAAALVSSTVGTVAQDQVEFELYDLHHLDSGLTFIQKTARRLHGEPPQRDGQGDDPREQGTQGHDRHPDAVGDPPDLFQSWGGGTLAQQVQAGLVRTDYDGVTDVAGDVRGGSILFQVDDAQYGLPYNFGAVGLWYNKDLLAQAGIDAPPTTWEEFLTDVQTLRTPVSRPSRFG